jgi:hypothetical protein
MLAARVCVLCWKAYACSDERVMRAADSIYVPRLRTELVASLTNIMQQLTPQGRPALLATVSLLLPVPSKLAVQIETDFTSSASCK